MESSVPGAWPAPEQRRKHTLVWIISSTLTAHFYLIQLSHYYHLTFPFQQQIYRHELVLFFYHLVFSHFHMCSFWAMLTTATSREKL